nr:hypothetical protein GCM10025730_45790 [Promicromonospora thailandica]
MVGSSAVPAARSTARLLSFLAAQPGPVPAGAIAHGLGLPRSSVYHLLSVLRDEGFVRHFPDERRYGLGVAALGLGSAYTRQAPLTRLAAPSSPGWSRQRARTGTSPCSTAARCCTSWSSARRAARPW